MPPKRKIEAVEEPVARPVTRTRSSTRKDVQEATSAKPQTRASRRAPAETSAGRTTRSASRKGDDKVDSKETSRSARAASKPTVKRVYTRKAVPRPRDSSDDEEEEGSGSDDEIDSLSPRKSTKPAPTKATTSRTTRGSARSKPDAAPVAQKVEPKPRTTTRARQRNPEPTPPQTSERGSDNDDDDDDEEVAAVLNGRSRKFPRREPEPVTRKRPRARAEPQESDPEINESAFPPSPTRRGARKAKLPVVEIPVKRKRMAAEPSELHHAPPSPTMSTVQPSVVDDTTPVDSDTDNGPRKVLHEETLPKTPSRKRVFPASRTITLSDDEEEVDNIPSPTKSPAKRAVPPSPRKQGAPLPAHLLPCLNAQKRAVLRALQCPPLVETTQEPELDNADAYQQLSALLEGTVERNEGNSCMLLGPRGSGKTRVVDRCISELKVKPIIIRLSGWVQGNDRLALRQIAVQLAEQTGNNYLSQMQDEADEEEEEEPQSHRGQEDMNPFLDDDGSAGLARDAEIGGNLPPASHLPALIALLPSLSRPTIVIVDGFDLFALHPRQALLYCLLDTVQSCQSTKGNKGLAVIGLTARVDTLQLLEKRVKSRFSGRILRTRSAKTEGQWMMIVRSIYAAKISTGALDEDVAEEWDALWAENLERFLKDSEVQRTIADSMSVVSDLRLLVRILTPPIVRLSEKAPFPTAKQLALGAQAQRARPSHPFLCDLSYPALCLLIASRHSAVSGHPVFTFEMLFEAFTRQLKLSAAAPVQLHGTSIGMVKCSREVLMTAFEALSTARIFVCAAAPSGTTAKEFVKYRCVVEREDMKKAVEKTGQTNLRKWWNKAT